MKPNEKVKYIRESLDLSQEKFALKIGLKQRTLSYIEQGAHKIDYLFLTQLIKAYKVNIDWFFNNRGQVFEINMNRSKKRGQ